MAEAMKGVSSVKLILLFYNLFLSLIIINNQN